MGPGFWKEKEKRDENHLRGRGGEKEVTESLKWSIQKTRKKNITYGTLHNE